MKISEFIPLTILFAYFALSGFLIWLAYMLPSSQVEVGISDFVSLFSQKEPEPDKLLLRDWAYIIAAISWISGLVFSVLKFKSARNQVYLVVFIATIIIPIFVIYMFDVY